MKKLLLVLALAVALTFAFAATALADHSPSFYILWSETGGYEGANATVPSPHSGYAEGTQKCGVCHAAHRAAVAGLGWVNVAANATYGTPANPDGTQPNGMNPFPAEAGGTNRATRSIYLTPDGENTQMLLRSDVAGACDYCHIETSIGGEQIYAGAVKYRLEATAGAGGSNWEGGFAHNNACSNCHAVHGAFSRSGGSTVTNPTGNVVFQGALLPKVVKAYAKASTTWQSAVVYAGSTANLTGLFTTPGNVQTSATLVSANNVPLFEDQQAAIDGVAASTRIGVDIADAQVTAHCTFCHENYGYASEDLINPQNVNVTGAIAQAQRALPAMDERYVGKGLFQGPWVYHSPADSVLYSVRAAGTLDGQIPVKNHPMKRAGAVPGDPAAARFVAGGSSLTSTTPVAWANSDTCRSCHDAGVEEFTGVMIQSFPHFTPGYFKFLKSADYAGDTMANIDAELAANPTFAAGDPALATFQASILDSETVIEDAMCTSDGACLKCHVDSTNALGVGKTW